MSPWCFVDTDHKYIKTRENVNMLIFAIFVNNRLLYEIEPCHNFCVTYRIGLKIEGSVDISISIRSLQLELQK